jgi:hypothetical protein
MVYPAHPQPLLYHHAISARQYKFKRRAATTINKHMSISRRKARVHSYVVRQQQEQPQAPIPVAAPPPPPAPIIISTRQALEEAYEQNIRDDVAFQRVMRHMNAVDVARFKRNFYVAFLMGWRSRAPVLPA